MVLGKGSQDNQPALGKLCHVKFVDSISYFLCDQGHCSLDHFIQLAIIYWARTILAYRPAKKKFFFKSLQLYEYIYLLVPSYR